MKRLIEYIKKWRETYKLKKTIKKLELQRRCMAELFCYGNWDTSDKIAVKMYMDNDIQLQLLKKQLNK